jgi:hypothetical protein
MKYTYFIQMTDQCKKLTQCLLESDFGANPRQQFVNLISKEKSDADANILLEYIGQDNFLADNIELYMKLVFTHAHAKMIYELTDMHKDLFNSKIEYYAQCLISASSDETNTRIANLFFDYFSEISFTSDLMSKIVTKNDEIVRGLSLSCNAIIEILCDVPETKLMIVPCTSILDYFTEHLDELSDKSFLQMILWCAKSGTWTESILDRIDENFNKLASGSDGANRFASYVKNCIQMAMLAKNEQPFKIWFTRHPDYNTEPLFSDAKINPFGAQMIFKSCYAILGSNMSMNTQSYEVLCNIISHARERTAIKYHTLNEDSYDNICNYVSLLKVGISTGMVNAKTLTTFAKDVKPWVCGFSLDDFILCVDNCEVECLDDILFSQFFYRGSNIKLSNALLKTATKEADDKIKYGRLKYLISLGSNINQDNGFLLFCAVFNFDTADIKFLTENGANMDLVRDAVTAIDFENENGINSFYPKNQTSYAYLRTSDNIKTRQCILKCIDVIETNAYVCDKSLLDQLYQEFDVPRLTYPACMEEFVNEIVNANIVDQPQDDDDQIFDLVKTKNEQHTKLVNTMLYGENQDSSVIKFVESYIESDDPERAENIIKLLATIVNMNPNYDMMSFAKSMASNILLCVKLARGSIFVNIVTILIGFDGVVDFIKQTIQPADHLEHYHYFSDFMDMFDANQCSDHEGNCDYIKKMAQSDTAKNCMQVLSDLIV